MSVLKRGACNPSVKRSRVKSICIKSRLLNKSAESDLLFADD